MSSKMLPAETKTVAGDALSPSRITDYFEAKKSKNGGGKKESVNKSYPISLSMYLTPESSPDKDESQIESSSDVDDNSLSTNSGISSDYRDTNTLSDDLPASLVCPAHPESQELVAETKEDRTSEDKPVPNDSILPSFHTETTQLISPCIEPSTVTQVKSSPPKSTVNDDPRFVRDTASASPSIPRPKLRRGKKHEDRVAASLDTVPIKAKPTRRKKKEVAEVQTSTILDFFPIRRSERQTRSEIQKQKQELMEKLILNDCEDGLVVKEFPNKGRGVMATKDFNKGDFVIEYAGSLLLLDSAKKKEVEYGKDPSIGCYMYYFRCGHKSYCVDATAESGHLGRLINHSRDGNLTTKAVLVQNVPHLVLFAALDIKVGEELSYDYGDRSKAVLDAHPWLKS